MEGKSRHRIVTVIAIIFGILISLFGVQHFMKHSGSTSPQLIFSEIDDSDLQSFLTSTLADLPLHSDLQISLTTQDQIDQNNNLLYQILVPTTNFYASTTSVETTDPNQIQWLPITELDFQNRLLSYQGAYYLETLSAGAKFQYLVLDGNPEDRDTASQLLASALPEFPTTDTVLTFAQTGVTALARKMTTKLEAVADATYFASNIRTFLNQFDFTHTSNEASFSELANSDNICSPLTMINVLTATGINIVELTGNHNQDCGDKAALSTLQTYHDLGIQTFGGGATADEAAIPLTITSKGSQITLLGYNYSTGGYTLDDTPGANFYTETDAVAQIENAKAHGDTVIVDIQFFECNSYDSEIEDQTCDYANSSEGDQIGFFRHLIDLGADLVVGTAAHQPQTYELYRDGAIYYGLGNLFFDQAAWPGTTRSLILVHYFWHNQLIQTRIVSTVYDWTFQTKLMDDTSASNFLQRLTSVSPKGE